VIDLETLDKDKNEQRQQQKQRQSISRSGYAFAQAFGRAVIASRCVFRREAEASLYLAAKAAAKAKQSSAVSPSSALSGAVGALRRHFYGVGPVQKSTDGSQAPAGSL
jgi:hypothetical protein